MSYRVFKKFFNLLSPCSDSRYSSGQKKVAVSVPFRIHSVEIKRPRERALNAHKGIYLKRKLLLHTRAGARLRFVRVLSALRCACNGHYSTAVKPLLHFALSGYLNQCISVSTSLLSKDLANHFNITTGATLKGSTKPLQHHNSQRIQPTASQR